MEQIIDDIKLVRDIINGDKQSEKIFYNKYSKIIKNFLIKKYTFYNDIDDDVSEIMIKIFLNLKQYDASKSKLNVWIFSIVKNYLIDKWRCNNKSHNTQYVDVNYSEVEYNYEINNTFYDKKKTSTINVDYIDNKLYNSTINYDDVYNSYENNEYINYITTLISPKDYAMLNMKYVYGFNYNEIGNEFQLTSTTVGNRVNYIKTKLKKKLMNE